MIVIVGAGLAGLAAAYKLVKSNYLDFVLVEAQDYVGGRVRSVRLSDEVRLDLGAQWLHGHKENPIYDWLESLDCIDELEEGEIEFEGLFMTADGERVSSRVVSKTLEVLLDAKNQLYRNPHLASESCRPIDIFRKSVIGALPELIESESSDCETVELIQNWFELYEAIDNACESLEELSIKAYSGWTNFDDGHMVRIKGGWQRVVDKLEGVTGRGRIRLNSVVEEIYRHKDGKICVNIKNQMSISCDHVILTLSVGALKRTIEDQKAFLSPKLGDMRSCTIRKFGFGPVNKIFLQFAEPYLQEERGLKVLHRKPHDISKSEDHRENCNDDWTRGILSFDLVYGAPNVLLVWVGGPEASMMELISDEDLTETLLNLLTVCLPDRPPPKLVSIHRSAWSSNSYVGGAYSYPSRSCNEADMQHVWDPVCDTDGIPRVLLAGEATAGAMYATAHGAIMSGWREADRLLKVVNEEQRR